MPSGGALASLTGLNAYNTPTAIIPAISPAISLQGRTPSRPSARPLRPRVPSRHFPERARLRPPRPSSITPAPCRPLPDAAQRVLAVSHSERAVRAGHVLRATLGRAARWRLALACGNFPGSRHHGRDITAATACLARAHRRSLPLHSCSLSGTMSTSIPLPSCPFLAIFCTVHDTYNTMIIS